MASSKATTARHPGQRLKDELLLPLGLTVAEAAAQLGVARVSLSRVLNGGANVSTEMALRLERWLGAVGGGTAADWLALQAAHDLGVTMQPMRQALKQIRPAAKIGG